MYVMTCSNIHTSEHANIHTSEHANIHTSEHARTSTHQPEVSFLTLNFYVHYPPEQSPSDILPGKLLNLLRILGILA